MHSNKDDKIKSSDAMHIAPYKLIIIIIIS